MKKLFHWLMLSCKKATGLIEKKAVTRLTFKEGLQLRLHKSMCDACTAYEKQSKKIDGLLRKHLADDQTSDTGTLKNEALKEKILNRLTDI
ncbi:MAG: hypothetical protein HZA79_08140 [Sphingobacteriales bacterium]|nr:hypothetical protein [Sphingobacteriales bacterium]